MKNILFVLLLLPCVIHAQSPVTHSAGTGENVPSLACLACPGTEWNNVLNISAEDGKVASTVLNPHGNCFMSICESSRFLYAHHFNFSIPTDAIIDSVIVDIKRSAMVANGLLDSTVRLVKMGMPVGKNLKSTDLWPDTLTYESYGHKDPLWSTTWLPSELNDSLTGIDLKVLNLTLSDVMANVDHIKMTIYYTTSTGIYVQTSSPSVITWMNTPDRVGMNFFTATPVMVSVKVFSESGQEIKTFEEGKTSAGQNHFNYSTSFLSSGIYFLRIKVDDEIFSKPFVVVR
ncbi:MAG: T9SS type A sorting domain-containing protein [Ferruginibacter sp.]